MSKYIEAFDTRSSSKDKEGIVSERRFFCDESDPDEALHNCPYVIGAAHPVHADCYVKSISADIIPQYDHTLVIVKYGPQEKAAREKNVGETWTWDISTQQVKILNAISQTHYLDDVGLKINVDDDSINGVDAMGMTIGLRCSKRVPDSEYDSRLLTAIGMCRDGRPVWNNSEWYGIRAGCILFVGLSASKNPIPYDTEHDQWTFDYNFIVGQPWDEKLDFQLSSGEIVNIRAVLPFEYLWTQTDSKVASREHVENPGEEDENIVETTHMTYGVKSVHIAQIYHSANFEQLDLNSPWYA